jgi:spore coat polysaccharide biosynthesis protein SpsF
MLKKKTAFFIQARTSSKRFPQKIFKKIDNIPNIIFMIRRLEKKFKKDHIFVLTSNNKSDDKLSNICRKNKINIFRGNLKNVLDRYFSANKLLNFKNIVRLTGDCPLIDTNIIKKVLDKHFKNKNDYTSNILKTSFPQGLDVEVFTKETLNIIFRYAKKNYEKEHVTLYLRNNQKKFKCQNIVSRYDLSHIRLCLDYREDLDFIKNIVKVSKNNRLQLNYKNMILITKKLDTSHFNKLNKKNKFKNYLKFK